MADQAIVKQEESSVSHTDLSSVEPVEPSEPIEEPPKSLKLEHSPNSLDSDPQDPILESLEEATDFESENIPKQVQELPKNLKVEFCNRSAETHEPLNFEPVTESVVSTPVDLPKNLKLEPYNLENTSSFTNFVRDIEFNVSKTIELPKNLKLEPYTKPIEVPKSISIEHVIPKPIELPKNVKLEPFSKPIEEPQYPEFPPAPKSIELAKNLKLAPFNKPLDFQRIGPGFPKAFELPKGFRIEALPKPIELPKGFKIEPIPKHLELAIPKPFQIDSVARNLEIPLQERNREPLEVPIPKPYKQRHFEPSIRKPYHIPKRPRMVVETDHSKYTFPMKMTNPYERENWTVSTDHCYARPWNWRPESTFLKPAKTIFIQKNISRSLFSKDRSPKHSEDEDIDVEFKHKENTPLYDVEKAMKMMEECDKQAALMRGNSDENWEEKINKSNWTPAQLRLYSKMVTILDNFHLAKLSQSGVRSEPILRRTAIDKAVSRTRRLFATVSLDIKVLQWLHNILLDNLDRAYLGDYLDILQTLKAKLPSFVDKMIHGSQRIGALSNENLASVLKKPWDPVASSLNQDKPKKLPGGPIIILVPSGPIHTKRAHKWMLLLANLGNVVSVPTNFTGTGTRLTMTNCLDQLFALTRGRVQEMRETYPGKHIILVGFGAGATLAIQVAHVENVFCVVSLGFSMLTAEGRRGEPDDNMLELQCPVLFVIGQSSNTCFQEDLEDIRSRMRVETGLIVVGSANNNLIVNKKKKREEGITQSIVDRCIIDEVGEFISGLILSPYPPQIRQSPTPVPEIVPKKTPKSNERKRYNSAMSEESEPPSPTPAPPVPRLSRMGLSDISFPDKPRSSREQKGLNFERPSNRPSPEGVIPPDMAEQGPGRPPGASRIKSKLEAKWAAQIAQGTSSTSSTPSSAPLNANTSLPLASDIITVDDESSDTASASESLSIPPSPQRPHTSKSSPKGIVLAQKLTPVTESGGLIKQLLSPSKRLKMLKPVATSVKPVTGAVVASTKTVVTAGASGGERSVKVNISPRQNEPARLQAYNLNRNLPLKGQLSTLLQGGIKTIPPVQNRSSSGIKVLENLQLSGNATAKLISTASGRTIDLSKLTAVGSTANNVMLLPDGKIKTVQRIGTISPASSRGPPNHNFPSNIPPYSVAPRSVQNSMATPLPRHPSPRYGRPLFPLPSMSFMGGMMKGSMPMMMKRPKFASSRRSMPSMVNPKPRPIKRHTYVPLPSQSLPPPTNLTSQDIMDLPIIFADDNQVIDTNVPTDLSTTGPSSQRPSKLVSSSTPTNKFVIVSKSSNLSNFIISPSTVKRPMPLSMVKQPPNKYAKIILSKKGMEENLSRLNTVKLPPDAIRKSLPQVEQADLEKELKHTVLYKSLKSNTIKNITVLPKNATMETFEKMEQAAAQEDDDPDYVPPKNLKL